MTEPAGAPELVLDRATQAVIWGMPAVNYERMLAASVAAGAGLNQILYWPRPPDWHNQSLTPNPDTIYLMPFFDLGNGPVVLEIPPADVGSINGSVMDSWQCPLDDVGPAGADRGKGARYLIVPPGHTEPEPDGYHVLRCDTMRGYALLRSFIAHADEDGIAAAVAYGRTVQLYPLADATASTRLVEATDQVYDALIPYDARYFEFLHAFVQAEPWLARDMAMVDQLASLGIVRGATYAPQASHTLDRAAVRARDYLDARYRANFTEPYFPGTAWALPVPLTVIHGQQTFYGDPGGYPVDDRAVMFSIAFFSAKQVGTGQFYLMGITDEAGNDFDGAKHYRLTVPPDAPVTQYWSITVYDRATHGLIRTMSRGSRASNSPELEVNADGSVDVYIGPTAPDGREPNWIPTDPAGRFEALFRFYGPTPALAAKTWSLPDVVAL